MGDDLFRTIGEYLHNGKEAVELFKVAYSLMPVGEKRSEIERRVHLADDAMRRSDVALAQKLGFNLCQCQFPPSIMLWKQSTKSYICQNMDCGRTIKTDFDRDLSSSSGREFF